MLTFGVVRVRSQDIPKYRFGFGQLPGVVQSAPELEMHLDPMSALSDNTPAELRHREYYSRVPSYCDDIEVEQHYAEPVYG
ncbi:MAG: hypothetical protein WCI94_21710 [Rhodospirillales bacterium]